ncbi:N-acetylmuramoyl-L-alanine amidase [Methylocella tundrae]|uniref:N-acetylmuramoyl-L-alanine amidase n=2 Tax=Methylocella tundrae TaxID=227605 RepID=A0A8B6MBI3_METTU|nr:N-acetylmuramoyl-L-alanine amidase [Methylocella tundrae]VTZ52353.1 N-acetylmuramoyl-L-alanine amidase [Methylocella tundrae]
MALEMADIAAKIAGWRRFAAAVLMLGALSAPVAPAPRAEDSASSTAPAPSAAGAIEASAADLDDGGDHASLVFELSAPVEAAGFVLADPDRIIIDASEIRFMIDSEIGKAVAPPRRHGDRDGGASVRTLVNPRGLVTSFRFGQIEKGRSRIVIDLSGPARIVRAGCEKSGGGGKTRLVIELAKTDRAHFAAAAQTARAALAQPARDRIAEKIQSAAGKPIVMIDPGHGGIDRGASVNGLIEKDLVLDFAKALAARLDADGLYQPVLTREDDSFISLSERVRMARDRKVALFVSIHADTLAEATDVSGATVYTVSDRASDAEAARVAEKENQADSAAGLDRTEDASEVSDILFDLTRRETRAYSHVFAHTLLNYWKVAGRLNKNPQRSAGFRVLKAPDVPSVLLELGYLSNEKDDIALSSPQWRDQAVSRMAEAIKAFFSERGTSNFSEAVKDPAPVGAISSPSVATPERPDAPEGDSVIGKAAIQAPLGDSASDAR